MKKINCVAIAWLLIVISLLMNGCKRNQQETQTATESSVIIESTAVQQTTDAPTEKKTEPDKTTFSMEATTVQSTTAASSEKITESDKSAFYGTDYPDYGIDLAKKSLAEIIGIMDSNFVVNWADDVIYAPDSRIYICNESLLSGIWFFIGDASEAFLNGEYGLDKELALTEIKQDILNGKYTSFDFVNVRQTGNLSHGVYVGMTYKDFSEAIGHYDSAFTGGQGESISHSQYLYNYADGIDFVLVLYESIGIGGEITVEQMKEANPQIKQFIVMPK